MSDITSDPVLTEDDATTTEPADEVVESADAVAESAEEVAGSETADVAADPAESVGSADESVDEADEVAESADAVADEGAGSADAVDEAPVTTDADAVDEAPVTTDVDAVDEAPATTDVDAADGDVEEEEPEAPVRRRKSPYDRPGRWYVIHTQSGYENKVRSNLLARTQSMNMEEQIFEVVIPLEDVVEFKNGKKVIVQKKVFPGYLLTRMFLNDDSWFVVRNTPGVTGFIGAGNKPSPLPRKDVESFLSVKEDGDEPTRKGRPRLEYSMGETVRVKEGPFADFQGEIVEINEDQLKLKVLVNIFGRETPVELQFAEVGKV